MKAIILAAGKGLRLNGSSRGRPKCLIEIGGTSLIERQIWSIRNMGIDDVTVVAGFEADSVREVCGGSVRYVVNDIFDRTNSLYSLWLAREAMKDGFVVLNSDVLFHPQLLGDLMAARAEDALLVSFNSNGQEMGAEEMKVKAREGLVEMITKDMDPKEADGENVGIAKFGAEGAAALIGIMDGLIDRDALLEWAPRAFLEFSRTRPLHAISTRGYPWIEIDFPEDYRRAVEQIMPRLPNSTGDLEHAEALPHLPFFSPLSA